MLALLANRARSDGSDRRLPIGDVIDAGTRHAPPRLAITLRPGTDPDHARAQLASLRCIHTETPAAYPAPLASLLRSWIRQQHRPDTAAALTSLEEAIRQDRKRNSRN